MSGLAQISRKLLTWLEERTESSFLSATQREALFHAQQQQLTVLEARLAALTHDHERTLASERDAQASVARLQASKQELTRALQQMQQVVVKQRTLQTTSSDQIHKLQADLRGFVALVRSEIKKKFGYLPDAIAHADAYERILAAMRKLDKMLVRK